MDIDAYKNQRLIFLDTETTGFSFDKGDKIIEIGIVEVQNLEITSRFFHTLVNPQRTIPLSSTKVHGIYDSHVREKDVFKAYADEILKFIGDSNIVAHNAIFDLNFINGELKNAQKNIISKDRVIDSLRIARQKFPGQQNSLDALCKRLQISLDTRRERHGALIDSYLLAKVFIKILKKEKQKEMFSLINSSLHKEALNDRASKIVANNSKIDPSYEEIELHNQMMSKILRL